MFEARQAVQRFCLKQQVLKKIYTFLSNIIVFLRILLLKRELL
jgi:hypothetical protein